MGLVVAGDEREEAEEEDESGYDEVALVVLPGHTISDHSGGIDTRKVNVVVNHKE